MTTEIKKSQEDIDMSRLFSTELGKKTLDYLSRVFYDNSVYERNDPYHTAYRAGQQDVIGFIKEGIDDDEIPI